MANIEKPLQGFNINSNHRDVFPSFNKPYALGCFSLDSDRDFQSNMSQLKYLSMEHGNTEAHFDLNEGIDNVIRKNEDIPEKLDNILKWILQRKFVESDSLQAKNKNTKVDIVCYRGLLTTIMCTPYENLDDWIICASKWKGTIYLCAIESEESIKKRKSRTEQQKKFMSWGYKFEQYMTADKPKGRPKTDYPVNEKEEFCVMFQSKMSDHHLLYGAEMDCVNSETEVLTEQDLANAHFIELKTNRMIEDRRQDMNFRRFKLRKIWCQSFLVGIDTVVCGYRDDAGVVHQLEELELREIPKMTKGIWYPVVCMDFCDRFLTHVKNLASKNLTDCDPASVIKFEWKPKQNITAELICGHSKFSFLPKWFTDNSQCIEFIK